VHLKLFLREPKGSGLKADAGPEKQGDGGRVADIHLPNLTVFTPAAGRANGTAVIICPGGSYVRLAFQHEGIVPAQWFASHRWLP